MSEEKEVSNGEYFLGLDGGGTKTDCVLVDASGKTLARSTAGPSNPIRAGYAKAWFTLSDAADMVLEHQHIKAGDIRGIYAGIGGAGREVVARRIGTFLENAFPQAVLTVKQFEQAAAALGLAMKEARLISEGGRLPLWSARKKVVAGKRRYPNA